MIILDQAKFSNNGADIVNRKKNWFNTYINNQAIGVLCHHGFSVHMSTEIKIN